MIDRRTTPYTWFVLCGLGVCTGAADSLYVWFPFILACGFDSCIDSLRARAIRPKRRSKLTHASARCVCCYSAGLYGVYYGV